MNHTSLILACILAMLYVTSCAPRVPEESSKAETEQPATDLESIDDPIITSMIKIPRDAAWSPRRAPFSKRGWNNLNNMWGKRDWNKLNNMWGKRDWNKLNNMWGKRETTDVEPYWGKRDWNKLSNVWGKRGWNNLSNVWGKRTTDKDDGSKRTTNWNNLRSMWGKRAADWDIPAAFERLPDEETLQGLYIPDQM